MSNWDALRDACIVGLAMGFVILVVILLVQAVV